MKKTAKQPPSAKRTRSGERRLLEGLVAGLSQRRDELGVKIRQQADELKLKNGQLRHVAQKQIKAQERIRILTQAMESSGDGIFILDARKPDYPVVYANHAFRTMTGRAKRKILGREYLSLRGMDADPRVIENIKRAIQRGSAFHEEILSVRKNGGKRWHSLRIAPVRAAGGAVTHYVGIQTDVTPMRERELKIDDQREELLHVTRVGKLAEFVSSLAHEISQPLTSILAYAQAAQRMLAEREPDLQHILSYIINDDQRAIEVIQRLRSLLKKAAPEMKPVDINALINDTIVLIATDAAVRNVAMKLELADNLPLVRGDRIQLQQVLLNLISNSFDALEGGQEPGEILIRTSRKDSAAVVVAVSDSGCGIPAENMKKIFSHFFTSKPDGLGMGLSISRSIVEAHGGRLDVESKPGRGTTFFFTLPADTRSAR